MNKTPRSQEPRITNKMSGIQVITQSIIKVFSKIYHLLLVYRLPFTVMSRMSQIPDNLSGMSPVCDTAIVSHPGLSECPVYRVKRYRMYGVPLYGDRALHRR